jgi:hypothetical protein
MKPIRQFLCSLSACLLAGCSDQAPSPGSPKLALNPVPDATPGVEELLPEIPGFESPDFEYRLAETMDKADPKNDTWDTETFSAVASSQLRELAHLLESGEQNLEEHSLVPFISEDFTSSALRPRQLKSAFSDETVQVLRGKPSSEQTLKGRSGFAAGVEELLRPLADATDRHVKFKLYQVERSDTEMVTAVDFAASGSTQKGIIQQNAIWRITWETTQETPRLLSIEVEDFEEIIPGDSGCLAFTDATVAVLGKEASFQGQLSRGAGYWTNRLERRYNIDSTGHQGIAIADVDNDGLEDVYICQQGGMPNLLFLQNADGTLRDVSAEAGVDWMENTHAALFVDLDNDGDQDLVLARVSYMLIMENNGKGGFEFKYRERNESVYSSIAAIDYDNDRLLDLYFCGNTPSREAGEGEGARGGAPLPYHDANNGGSNLLLHNESSWKFRDATKELGLDENNSRFSFAAAWEDYDNDGDPDLYVANDFGRNHLYRNDEGPVAGSRRFTDAAAEAGVEDISAGMSVTWGDYDRDGAMDLYVSNMFSSAGNRVAYQRKFREGTGESLGSFRRHARGNSLFHNSGDGTFTDVSVSSAATMGRWAWGAKFADLNNDGWEDLYVANGYITSEETDDL